MALTADQKSKLLNLGLATGGGAGAGALAEYLLKGKVGWMGPTGGALAGGGGYLAASPGSRDAVGALVGWGDAEKAEKAKAEAQVKQDKIDQHYKTKQFIGEYYQHHNRMPNADTLQANLPFLPDEEIERMSRTLHGIGRGVKNEEWRGKGFTNKLKDYGTDNLESMAWLARSFPGLASKVPGAPVLGKAAPHLMALNQVLDFNKGMFYDEQKGEHSLNVLDNMKATQNSLVDNLTNNDDPGWVQAGRGFFKGLDSPIRSTMAFGLTGNDIAAERDKLSYSAVKDSLRRGDSKLKTLWKALSSRHGKGDLKPMSPEEKKHAAAFDAKRRDRIETRKKRNFRARQEQASQMLKKLNPKGLPWEQIPEIKAKVIAADKKLQASQKSGFMDLAGDWLH